jgi:hypothetical protein
MSSSQTSPDKRVKKRLPVQMRVDIRLITEQERVDILAGLGFPDLENEGMALASPRHGLHRSESRDMSASGMRLKVDVLRDVEPGAALCMDLHLPGERRVVKLLGDVMWAGEQGGEGVAGLRIAALEEEGLRRLERSLNRAVDDR